MGDLQTPARKPRKPLEQSLDSSSWFKDNVRLWTLREWNCYYDGVVGGKRKIGWKFKIFHKGRPVWYNFVAFIFPRFISPPEDQDFKTNVQQQCISQKLLSMRKTENIPMYGIYYRYIKQNICMYSYIVLQQYIRTSKNMVYVHIIKNTGLQVHSSRCMYVCMYVYQMYIKYPGTLYCM